MSRISQTLFNNLGFEVGSPPSGWGLIGAGATFVRESVIVHNGSYSGKMTRNGTDCRIYQAWSSAQVIAANLIPNKSNRIYLSVWILTSVGGVTIKGNGASTSPPHSGSGNWEQLFCSYPYNVSSDMYFNIFMTQDGIAYFDDANVQIQTDFIQPKLGAIGLLNESRNFAGIN